MNWLKEVQQITTGDRRRDYGHPMTNFLRICLLWSVQLERPVSPRQFTSLMVLMKDARDMHRFKEDNQIDTIGYVAALEMVIERMYVMNLVPATGDIWDQFENAEYGIANMWQAYLISAEMDRLAESE